MRSPSVDLVGREHAVVADQDRLGGDGRLERNARERRSRRRGTSPGRTTAWRRPPARRDGRTCRPAAGTPRSAVPPAPFAAVRRTRRRSGAGSPRPGRAWLCSAPMSTSWLYLHRLGCCPEDERGMAKDSQKRPAFCESFRPRQTSCWHSGPVKPSEGCMNDPRAGFEQLLAELRPKLHRYCARMTGSVIDGEDVLQEAHGQGDRGVSRTPARSPIPRAGCSASPTTRRSISCAAARARRTSVPTRIST